MGKEEQERIVTAFKGLLDIPEQKQSLPGLDKDLTPVAEHTKLEHWDDEGNPYLVEYKGSGKLENKSAIITGGDSGIGRAVAIMFAREGASVTIGYLKEEQPDADDVKKIIESEGGKCNLVPGDLMIHSECERLIQEHLKVYGKLNILVNNASKQIQCEKLEDIDLKHVESTFQSNIIAMIAVAKYAIPHLKRGSSIINTSSVTAFKGSPAMLDYSSTKGAIITFTKSLAAQLAPRGIRVNSLCPGPVFTPLQPASRKPEQMDDWEVASLPLWGRVNQPSEMGPAYVYLASADSAAMSGAAMHLNNMQYMA